MTKAGTQPRSSSDPQAIDADPVLGQLKKLYDDVASEPLPDDLLKLLDKLDEAERNR